MEKDGQPPKTPQNPQDHKAPIIRRPLDRQEAEGLAGRMRRRGEAAKPTEPPKSPKPEASTSPASATEAHQESATPVKPVETELPSVADTWIQSQYSPQSQPKRARKSFNTRGSLNIRHKAATAAGKVKGFASQKRNLVIIGVVLVIIVASLAGSMLLSAKNSDKLPKSITSQAKFSLFYPQTSSALKVDKKSIKYDNSSGLLTYDVILPNNTRVNVHEQATPASFTDTLPAFNQLLQRLHEYYSFNTQYGVVGVTSPASAAQTAQLNTHGTLVIAKPDHNLSNGDWQKIFNSLKIVQS